MHLRLVVSTLCALAAVSVWAPRAWAGASTTDRTGRIEGSVTLVSPGGPVSAVDVRAGGTARVTFVLPIDVP